MTARTLFARRGIGPLAFLAAVSLLGASAPAERPSSLELLPQNTVMLLSVVDAPDLAEHFMNTALGRMSQDPQLKPLVGHLYGSLSDAVQEAQEQIGLSLPELLAIPQGELTLATIAPEEGRLATVAILDAGNQLSNARKLLQRATDAIEKSQAPKSEETIAGTKLTIYRGVGPEKRDVAIFEKDATICAGNNVDVVKQLLAAWNGEDKSPRLADNDRFSTIMARCRGAKEEKPQFLWFVDPVEILRAIGRRQTSVQVTVAMLPALGLDGLMGLGGTVALDAGAFESVVHVHVLMDSPRSGILKMIAFEPGDTTPEPWAPADAASYTTFHWNIQTSFKELSTLYNSFRGEGALAAAMNRRILGPTGIDFEKEILPALEGRITMITWIERPITLGSQTTLLALKLKETAPVEKALETAAAKNDVFLVRETHAGKSFYRAEVPQLEDRRPRNPEDADAPRPPRPEPCFGVLEGYLVVTNRPGIFKHVIVAAADGSTSLANELDFKLVVSKIRRQPGGENPALVSFNRPEEGMRMLYDLAIADTTRSQLRRQAENNRFFKSLDTALKENPLPPFEVLRRYLAPGGALLVDDETGLHYLAFSLRRK
jgi:hypothetical protein